MAWLKVTDTFTFHPLLLGLRRVRGYDERTLDEVTGFIVRLAAHAAAHLTDYVVDFGVAEQVGGARTKTLLRQATAAGLLISEGHGASQRWEIIQHDDFLHMPSKAEVLNRRQRDKDRNNKTLTAKVRFRDGDECRYCAKIVNWFDRKGGDKGGQFDHLDPGEAATLATYVVSCGECNRQWGNTPGDEKRQRLLPPPAEPFYSKKTAEFLTNNGYPTDPTPAQSGSERAGATRPESTSGSPAATARPRSQTTDAHARPTATATGTAAPARDEPTGPSTAATVRDSATEAPQPPARATPWAATAATTARPDFLSDTAATPEARPAPHPADTVPTQRMEVPPPRATGLGPAPNPQVTRRSDVWNPGRVGSGRAGSGAAGPGPGAAPSHPAPPGSRSQSPAGRRGKRGRRSKKE